MFRKQYNLPKTVASAVIKMKMFFLPEYIICLGKTSFVYVKVSQLLSSLVIFLHIKLDAL